MIRRLDDRAGCYDTTEPTKPKVLLHNLACLVHAIEKYGIGVAFPLGKVTP